MRTKKENQPSGANTNRDESSKRSKLNPDDGLGSSQASMDVDIQLSEDASLVRGLQAKIKTLQKDLQKYKMEKRQFEYWYKIQKQGFEDLANEKQALQEQVKTLRNYKGEGQPMWINRETVITDRYFIGVMGDQLKDLNRKLVEKNKTLEKKNKRLVALGLVVDWAMNQESGDLSVTKQLRDENHRQRLELNGTDAKLEEYAKTASVAEESAMEASAMLKAASEELASVKPRLKRQDQQVEKLATANSQTEQAYVQQIDKGRKQQAIIADQQVTINRQNKTIGELQAKIEAMELKKYGGPGGATGR